MSLEIHGVSRRKRLTTALDYQREVKALGEVCGAWVKQTWVKPHSATDRSWVLPFSKPRLLLGKKRMMIITALQR